MKHITLQPVPGDDRLLVHVYDPTRKNECSVFYCSMESVKDIIVCNLKPMS